MSRAVLYQTLLKAAAKELRVKATSERAKDLAVLRLCRESITSKLISGRDVDPSALRWLVEELAKFAPPQQQKPLKIGVKFLEGPIAHCPACGWHRDQQPPPSPPSAPPPTETKPSSPVPSAPAANVVALRRDAGIGSGRNA
jgi:hypothetical protein